MLNELRSLSDSMPITPQPPKLKELPAGETLMLFINEDGNITEVQILPQERTKNLRKYGNFQGTFPAFNIELEISDKASKEKLSELQKRGEENISEIIILLDEMANFSKTKKGKDRGRSKINSCLNRIPSELRAKIGNIPEEFRALDELIDRASKVTRDGFLRQLKDQVFEKIRNNPDKIDIWAKLLTQSNSVVVEIFELGDFEYPVNHEKVLDWINTRLIEVEKADWKPDSNDAFGKPIDFKKAKKVIDLVRLPKWGDINLRSMFKDVPCQFRYGKIGSESFPIGLPTREEMIAALVWLGDEKREGKTWANLSGGCGFETSRGRKVPKKGRLFAYPSELTEDPPECPGLFTYDEKNRDPDGANFEAAAARVIPSIKGIVKGVPDAEMRVFVLGKPYSSGNRAKLLFSARYELSRLPDAAEEWQKGCENLPFLLVKPSIPFPSEVVKCLQCEWIRDGSEMTEIHGLGIGEGIKLLIETEGNAKPIVERALNLAVKNSTPLLLGYAHERQKGSKDYKLPGKGWIRKANKDKGFKAVHQVNLLPSIIGLLLFKLNIHKEDYMQNAPFLVGRFLALVDTLHKEYCKKVRGDEKGKGGIPNQLIGNAMMRTALGNPERAMSQLSDRLPVYQGWASTRGTALSRWTLKKMGEITTELSKFEWPERMRDAEKAQLLLGYLAREKKEEEQETGDSAENKNN